MANTKCPHCRPKKHEPYQGSKLDPYPKFSYCVEWPISVLIVLLLWAVGPSTEFKETLPEDFWASLKWQLEEIQVNMTLVMIIRIHFVFSQSLFLSGYLFAKRGYKTVHGNASGDAKMSWLKNKFRENETRPWWWLRWYNLYTTKLAIAHYLVNPKGYNGLVFSPRDRIHQSIWHIFFIHSYSSAIVSNERIEWLGRSVYFCYFAIATFVGASFGSARASGWYFGIGKVVTALRNEFENSENILSARKRMEIWVEGFPAEESSKLERILSPLKSVSKIS